MDSLIETFKEAYFDQVGNLAESDNSDIFELCYDAVITGKFNQHRSPTLNQL
jgi:hypothetical protein